MDIIHKSIGQLFAEVAGQYPDREALVHTVAGRRYSYQYLADEIDRVARGFLSQGIQPGDKIALWATNIAEWLFSLLALAKIGAITVPIDPAAPRDNLLYILEQSQSRGLIVETSAGEDEKLPLAAEARQHLPGLDMVIGIGAADSAGTISWNQLVNGADNTSADRLQQVAAGINPADPVALMYTSGTTGAPKGVLLDHLGLINKSMVSTQRQGISCNDRLCLFFPLYHMFGNTCIALAGLLKGAALIMPCRSFDPQAILAAIAAEKCTAIYGSPSMLIALVDHPGFQQDHWRTLSKGIIGGAPCPMALMRRLVEDIGVCDITVAYGITETSSWITMTHPSDPLELRVSTIGTALPCNEVKIVDPATGDTLGPGRQGELCTRGFLMKEYYKMPAATAAAIDREQWFHTGDLGVMDREGYVKITGRLKDVIVRNGNEIYPVEIEEVLYRLSEISEAQVFGFAAGQGGQQIAAWIKLKAGCRFSLDAVAAHLRKHLPEKKLPQYYKIVSEFPMTGSGKVQKFKMAQMAAKEYQDDGSDPAV